MARAWYRAVVNLSPFSWYVALLAAGLLLIVAEVFIPGGVAGVIGGLALLGAMGLGLAAFPAPWGFLSAIAALGSVIQPK